MRYHALKAEGVAIGSGVVEAANKTLVTQRMKRSGMRWRIASGQAVLTFRRPDQIRSLRPGMEGHHRRNRHTGQRQHQSLCRHRHRCLNSMNEAAAINAIRDSHPFEVKDDSSSPGIQVTDVVLWLYSQYRKGKQLPPKVSQILEYVLSHGWENDFSFVGVEKLCLQRFGPVFSQPLSAKKEKAAQELLVEFEKKRRASIEQYEHDRVRPYMRQVPPAIPAD